jgi:hypothetical protein
MAPITFEASKRGRLESSQEYSRILTAAVISAQFRQLLLSNPEKAITAGFGGEAFDLNTEDRSRLTSIRASSLADFASQLNSCHGAAMGFSAIAAD